MRYVLMLCILASLAGCASTDKPVLPHADAVGRCEFETSGDKPVGRAVIEWRVY